MPCFRGSVAGRWTLAVSVRDGQRGKRQEGENTREGWAAGEEAGGRKYTFINHVFTEQRDCPF